MALRVFRACTRRRRYLTPTTDVGKITWNSRTLTWGCTAMAGPRAHPAGVVDIDRWYMARRAFGIARRYPLWGMGVAFRPREPLGGLKPNP